MTYYAVETNNPEQPLQFFETLDEAMLVDGKIYECNENHVCTEIILSRYVLNGQQKRYIEEIL